MNQWTIRFDGGIRGGNPGGIPTYGVEIKDGNGTVLHTMSGIVHTEHLTNNVAEWSALRNALAIAWMNRTEFTMLVIIGDSELVIKQLTGEYSVNADHLKPLHQSCQQILHKLIDHTIELHWNRREKNEEADALAEQAHKVYKYTGGE